MVLADGSLVTVGPDEHPDLFWAIRGGGGNFGIVTSFLFRLHPIDTVIAGPTLWDLDDAAEVMQWYREFITKAPDDLTGFFAFLTVPPAPMFPEHLHMKKMCGVVWCYYGPGGPLRGRLQTRARLQGAGAGARGARCRTRFSRACSTGCTRPVINGTGARTS